MRQVNWWSSLTSLEPWTAILALNFYRKKCIEYQFTARLKNTVGFFIHLVFQWNSQALKELIARFKSGCILNLRRKHFSWWSSLQDVMLHYYLITQFVSSQKDILNPCYRLRSPIVECWHHDWCLLQTFLLSGGDRWINTPGINGRRSHHFHAQKKVQVLLIDYGAHLDAVDADGSTPRPVW